MRRWVNVIVVVIVLGLVAGLVIAAVPRVRHAAASMDCSNNLKQLGIAVEDYHSTYGNYPPATIPLKDRAYPDVKLPPEKRLSWLVAVVPYTEQVGLVIDQTKPWDAEPNLEPRFRFRVEDHGTTHEAPVGQWKLVRCPSNPAVAGPDSLGLTHYVGVAGVGADAAHRSAGSPGIGFFGHDRLTRQEDIEDGAATTMMAVETTRKNGPWTAGGYPTVRGLDPSGGAYLGAGGQFSSNHCRGDVFALTPPSATNVLFADGSVRSLTASVSPTLFQALATIAGGEEVGNAADW